VEGAGKSAEKNDAAVSQREEDEEGEVK